MSRFYSAVVFPELYDFLHIESYKLPKYKDINCKYPKMGKVYSIPKTSHHIWLDWSEKLFDKPALPKNETLKALARNIHTMDKLAEDNPWKHNLWTNSHLLKETLEKEGQYANLKILLLDENDSKLQITETIDNLLSRMQVGAAVDLLKYSILNEYGGIALDLNYKLLIDIDPYLSKNDFLIQKSKNVNDLENYFIASKPKHPIMSNIIEFTKYIIESEESEESWGDLTEVTYKTLTTFFIMYSQIGNNCDRLLDYHGKPALRGWGYTFDPNTESYETLWPVNVVERASKVIDYYLQTSTFFDNDDECVLFGRDGVDNVLSSWLIF